METRKVLVGERMQDIKIRKDGDTIRIGENPELIVNLIDQKNYIRVDQQMFPYRKTVAISRDLLDGKRQNVLNTAVNHYYRQACAVAEGIEAARKYRAKLNMTVREVK